MPTTLDQPAVSSPQPVHRDPVDNRLAYGAFALAYLLGHGAAALAAGPEPVLDPPPWLPITVLGTGLVVGAVAATVASVRARRGASAAEVTVSKLLGMTWVTGFAALFLAVTGISALFELSTEQAAVLWPTGSGLIVGLLYLAEGSARRNALHYGLGSWLALVSGAALLLPGAAPYWAMAVAGGGAYAVATVLERRRLA
jgi:hypothetical protein